MIDSHVELTAISSAEERNEDKSDSDADSDVDMSELILVPNDASDISTMYEALKVCQVRDRLNCVRLTIAPIKYQIQYR